MEEKDQAMKALKAISIFKIGGYIELRTSDELEQILNQHIKNNTVNIIIDLQNVDYVSSAGWGVRSEEYLPPATDPQRTAPEPL